MGHYRLKSKGVHDPEYRINASMKLLYVSRSGGPLELVKQSPSILDLESLIYAKARQMHKHMPTHEDIIFEIRTASGRRIERLIYEYSEEE